MVMVEVGLFIVGPFTLAIAVLSGSWPVLGFALFVELVSAAFWISEKRTGWITRSYRRQ